MRRWLILLACSTLGAQTAPEIRCEFGPLVKDAGPAAKVHVAKGLIWAAGDEARRFLEFTGNPAPRGEMSVAGPVSLDWFAVITWRTYESLGFDATRPDPSQIAEAIRLGGAAANRDRNQEGRETLEVLDWAKKPVFDEKAGRLEFRLRSQESGGRRVENRFVYLLGRHGLIEVESVSEAGADASGAEGLINGIEWLPEEGYGDRTDWVALWVTAGAAAVAAALGVRIWLQRGQ